MKMNRDTNHMDSLEYDAINKMYIEKTALNTVMSNKEKGDIEVTLDENPMQMHTK